MIGQKKVTIAELETLLVTEEEINLHSDGSITVKGRDTRPTITELLEIIDLRDERDALKEENARLKVKLEDIKKIINKG